MAWRAIKVLEARVGLYSNKAELIGPDRFFLFLTDFHRIEEIEPGGNLDGLLRALDAEVEPSISVEADVINAVGPFTALEKSCLDRRYSLFGNEGLLFRFILHLLEARHEIFSAHACAMFDERAGRLFIVAGSAGAGKSCFILRGLELGLRLFSAEMTHFRLKGEEIEFLKGALQDNVRVDNLRQDFPKIRKLLGISLPDDGSEKVTLDLAPFAVGEDMLKNPEVIVVFPRIERGVETPKVRDVSPETAVRLLFENLTEKVGQPFLLYGRIPVKGWNSPESLWKRLEAARGLLAKARRVLQVYAAPQNCWEGVF